MVAMDEVCEHQEGVVLLAHTDHHPWTDWGVIAPHRAACRRIEDIGDVAGAVVVDEGVIAVDRGRIRDPEVVRRGEAYNVITTVARHLGLHRDAEAEEDMAGGIVHHEEVAVGVAAAEVVEVGQGGAQAIAHMAVTVTAAGVGIVDEKITSARGFLSGYIGTDGV